MATRGWEHVKESDLHRSAPKPPKYRNQKCEALGEQFDSKHEAECWMILKAREKAGEITHLKRQIPFALFAPTPSGVHAQVANYIADFVWLDDGKPVVADAKSRATKTQVYLLKRKWLYLQDGIEILEL